jgi:hypothetical protein
MGGWEIDGAYNKLYDPAEFEAFKGVVVKMKEMGYCQVFCVKFFSANF